MEETARFLPDDILLEILHGVSTDIATLFRCATACKRWRGLIGDRSFLLRCWPESACNQSPLCAFVLPKGHKQIISTRYPLFFIVPSIASFPGAPPRSVLDGAEPLTSHSGLLLLRLARGNPEELVQMAVYDTLAGVCNVLPPIECKVEYVSCAIVTSTDMCPLPSQGQRQRRKSPLGYSTFLKVLTIVASPDGNSNLYVFSSTHCVWSPPTKCFDEVWGMDTPGFWLPQGNQYHGTVCGAMVHWLVPYIHHWGPKHYIYSVSIDTDHTSLTEISTPPASASFGIPTLGVALDGSLLLCAAYKEAGHHRIEIWARGDYGAWHRTRVVKLQVQWWLGWVRMWSGEKSSTLLILDTLYQRVHKVDIQTGNREVWFDQHGLNPVVVPMEIDWLALFMSRLG